MSTPEPNEKSNEPDKTLISVYFDKYLDGTMTQEEADHLETLTRDHPEAANFAIDLRIQHIALDEQKSKFNVPVIEEPALRVRKTFVPGWIKFSLAASWLLAAGLLFLIPGKRENSIGVLTEINHCSWRESSIPTVQGSPLSPGVMILDKGIARFRLTTGVEFEIEAPAHLELVSDMHCRLYEGTLTAEVPERAKGFILETPGTKIIDHGTRFMVQQVIRNDAEPESFITVMQGEIEVKAHAMKRSLYYKTGSKIRVLKNHIEDISETEELLAKPDILQSEKKSLHLSSTSGRGQEAIIVRGNDLDFHNIPTMLLVKNSRRMFCRKAYLTFDLATLPANFDPKHTHSVELSVNMLPTYLGHALNMTSPTFEVYGIKEGLDNWQKEELNWETAPANHQGINRQVRREAATFLGSFQMQKGQVAAIKAIRGDALKQFIIDDTNDLISLLIIRKDMCDEKYDTVVHGFANSRHPTVSGPKLTFTY